jgi:hypothetical protein
MLCGCKMQIDWRMVPQDQRFHNLFGAGSETRSVIAHNTNERMRPNQNNGCAMMAMGTFFPKVVDSGVDFTGLGRWCWISIARGLRRHILLWLISQVIPAGLQELPSRTSIPDIFVHQEMQDHHVPYSLSSSDTTLFLEDN